MWASQCASPCSQPTLTDWWADWLCLCRLLLRRALHLGDASGVWRLARALFLVTVTVYGISVDPGLAPNLLIASDCSAAAYYTAELSRQVVQQLNSGRETVPELRFACMLQNFGGNSDMYGSLSAVVEGFSRALVSGGQVQKELDEAALLSCTGIQLSICSLTSFHLARPAALLLVP